MDEIGRNIFWAILSELFFVFLAIILKENKQKSILVLVAGTIISGIVGFWSLLFSPNSYDAYNTRYEITNSNAASIDDSWVFYYDYLNNERASNIYVSFRVVGKKDVPCEIRVSFVNADTGNWLLDTNGLYVSSDGIVSTMKKFTPQNDNSYYEKFMLTIPWDEIEGERPLTVKYTILIFDLNSNTLIGHSDLYYY